MLRWVPPLSRTGKTGKTGKKWGTERSCSGGVNGLVTPRLMSRPRRSHGEGQRRGLEQNGSNNLGKITLSGTGNSRSQAEKQRGWFRVWACLLKKSLRTGATVRGCCGTDVSRDPVPADEWSRGDACQLPRLLERA